MADEYVVNRLLTCGGSMTLNFASSGTGTVRTTWPVFDPNGGVSGFFRESESTGAGLTWRLGTSSTIKYEC